MSGFSVDNSWIVTTLQQLIQVPSVNPAFDRSSQGEGAVGDLVARIMGSLGMRVERQEVSPGRSNVLGWVEGTDPGRTLLFECHMDTVQVESMCIPPFGGEVQDGRVWGRGACDDKGPLAAMLGAVHTVQRSGRRPSASLCLAATVDEEYHFTGVIHLVESGLRADGAVVAEPTGLDVVVAHRGCVRFPIEVTGRAVHTSREGEGINAIEKMGVLMTRLRAEMNRRFAARCHPLVGTPTFAVNAISGGLGENTVPDLCVIGIDRRVNPGEDAWGAWEEFQAVVASLASSIPDLRARVLEPTTVAPSLECPPDSAVATALLAVVQQDRAGAVPIGVPYGTDGSVLAAAGIPTVVFGPGSILQAHTADEWIETEQLCAAARHLAHLIVTF